MPAAYPEPRLRLLTSSLNTLYSRARSRALERGSVVAQPIPASLRSRATGRS
jgi:hypothetical protein